MSVSKKNRLKRAKKLLKNGEKRYLNIGSTARSKQKKYDFSTKTT